MMNIAFVTLGFRPFRASGLDISGERLVKALSNKNKVSVIAGYRSNVVEEITDNNLEVYRIPINKSDWIGFSWYASQLLHDLNSKEHYDIVHFWDVHFAYAYSNKFVATLHHSFRKRSISINSNYFKGISFIKYKLYYFLARNLTEIPSLKKAKLLMADSHSTKKDYIENYKIPSKKIYLTRQGIDLDFFCNKKNEAATLRSQLGISQSDFVILFAGFITPRKNIETLFRAVLNLPFKPKLVLIGQWRDNKYREKVLKLIEQKNIIIEVGFVEDDLMPVYYSMADISVFPSLLEGFGLPLIESLACETPVIAANVSSMPEVIGPGGFLVDPKDYKQIANYISILANDHGLRRKFGKDGREYVEANFSLEQFVSSVIDTYSCAISL